MTEAQPQDGMLDDDSDEYWKHNEYMALKMIFKGASWAKAREDQEAFERLKADGQRLKELDLKFRR